MLQRKVFRALVGWLREKEKLRCDLRERCVRTRDRGWGGLIHRGFSGFEALPALEKDGRTGMARDFHVW
jgi:hypothetical protein